MFANLFGTDCLQKNGYNEDKCKKEVGVKNANSRYNFMRNIQELDATACMIKSCRV
jgi:hypothetical protein